jgi:uncharacterized protein (TIGR03083 family)
MQVTPVEPVLVTHLFPDMRAALLDVLRSLSDAEWARPTACAGWSVKDVAQHILADDLGNLSRRRDGFRLEANINSWEDLVAFVNDLNDVWVRATRRLSPRVLCDLLAFSGPQLHAYYASLDPYILGDPVSWAGPDPAPVWLDIAREYTEYWMHTQHICDAVGRPGLKEARFFAPLLDTFLRALPHVYRNTPADDGTLVKVIVPGEAGGEWHLVRDNRAWKLYRDTDLAPACEIVVDGDTLWRLVTRGIAPDTAHQQIRIEGDPALVDALLGMVSIIA